jgi:anti-sigma B factor antagonist
MDLASSHAEGKSLGKIIKAGALNIRLVEGPVQIFQLRGELDLASAPRLGEELARIEAQHPAEMVIDLSSLEFLDSTGLRLLVMANERASTNGTKLAFLRGPDAVARLFELTGVEERLKFLD